jgi:tetratricopeptide (TPR) repeat protein
MCGRARQLLNDNGLARVDCTKAIRLRPDYASAYHVRGLALLADWQCDAAIADFEQACRLEPELEAKIAPSWAKAHRGRSWKHVAESRWQVAIDELEAALRLDSNNPDARVRDTKLLAEACLSAGKATMGSAKDDEVVQLLHRAIELTPMNAEPYEVLGNFYFQRHEWGPAIEAFERFLWLVPDQSYHARRRLAHAKAQLNKRENRGL